MTLSGSSLVITKDNDSEDVVWRQLPVNNLISDSSIFQILSVDKTKQNGDLVLFGDRINLSYIDGNLVNLNKDTNTLFLDPDMGLEFVLESKMTGYYCNSENLCSIININDTIQNGESSEYRDLDGVVKKVYRHPGCFGLCDVYTTKNSPNYRKYILILSLCILLILLVVLKLN
tara:strand:- start:670 stop:1191 length:522 start_codon:yes stop_codon:yes gene_type:complete